METTETATAADAVMLLDTAVNTKAMHDQIDAYRDAWGDLGRADAVARRYVLGDHDDMVTDEQRRALGARAERAQRDNVIGQCVEQIAGRLLFRRFLVDNGETEQAWLATFARKNQFQRQIVALMVRTITDGSGALSVSWNTAQQRPIVHAESWWDGDTGMFAGYGHDGEVAWACSEWKAGEEKRRTVYLPDRILRFRQQSGWQLDDEIPWVKRDGTPLGVPVAHFPNGVSPFGPYPSSTVGEVLAMQDALNAVQFDLMSASALNGFPIYTETGVDDTNDDDDDHEVGPGQKWSTPRDTARFGVLPSGSIEQLLKHKNDLRGSIAAHFPVPDYRIGAGAWPSGFALQRGDSTMIAKVKLLGDTAAPGAVYIAHKATEIQNTFGAGGNGAARLDEDRLIQVEWAPPDQVDPGTQRELDLAEVTLYEALERLTPTLRAKTGHLTKIELRKVKQELADRQITLGDIAGEEPGDAEDDEEEA